ncbi:quinolinate phosphoribosyltransferase NadC [Psychroflexus torquis ATCC 700755]|uniref:Probable nicotinate-nucleotide pyrophosphorylase [carboxylating] n=1 Tax=Psychroflexus torquis (strain ATCC 700755 / CIP 106069 / ACAM 623) TaxID=313595 RepID=K4IC13_PSYTT|nr:carboxylating nicotinate-nucleotide diphosphorylase [Psychroflexus torquis]AFU67443.1 quinolinate phosphoribosyltransferase NadC [Psychroflexus torquis ATCC 700755]
MISEKQLAEEVQIIIQNAIREDVGEGDHSSIACIPENVMGKAKLLVKDVGIIAGINFAEQVFNYVDPSLKMDKLMQDGDSMSYGDIAFYISGSSRSILKSERLALNAMQRMSAIATKTHQFYSLLKDYKTKILDTRKTTPGFRAPEKQAVKIGGGENHRFALYDMIMLKDNHIDFAGGISEAIQKTLNYLKSKDLDLKIVVEARSLSEVEEILKNEGVYRILLDNFNFEETKKAVDLIDGKCLTESSGGITLETAQHYAECGVDYISSGALTHSVHNLDLSLKAI